MTVLIANDTVQTFLGQVREKAEICGADCKVLGHFEPHVETEAEMYERLKKRLDPDKFRRRVQEEQGQGYTIEQVMEYIHSQEPRK